MANHSNIHEPEYGSRWDERLHVLKLQAEIANLTAEKDKYRSDLDAIFTRIGGGQEVDLFFGDGRKITIRAPNEADQ